ncbi:MAG: glycosyltransferase family 2 protein [Bacteroidales bacterium]|nr:glycosyltransferase family 2 protein [Bacteroidales bacterium]
MLNDIIISVIIPSYKPKEYLWDCLDSLRSQTFSKDSFEVLIILNGCCEPYYGEIEVYLHKHNELKCRLIQTDTGGVSNARNIGLDESKGDYICFIDDDDFVSPNYLDELYKHAGKDTIPVCRPLSFIDGTEEYTDYNITKDYDKYYNMGKVAFYKPRRFFNGPVYKLIHRDIIRDRKFDTRFKNGEDSLFMFLISDRIKYVEFADKTTVYYRRVRQNSATQSKKPLGYAIKNYTKLMAVQTTIFFKGIPRYNFWFYLSSIEGRLKSILFD